jgi:cold shock CspA family protein
MRFDGKLEKWNDDRGFGFITPSRGGDPVFVHISAFPREAQRPRIGELLSFEVEPAGDGKRRAINVQRAAQRQGTAAPVHASRRRAPRGGSTFVARIVPVILVLGGIYAYLAFSGGSANAPASMQTGTPSSPSMLYSTPSASFRCDGRTHCSQMTSCEEAKFFLRNCPNVQMDGDRDGIPCEGQWCTGPFTR